MDNLDLPELEELELTLDYHDDLNPGMVKAFDTLMAMIALNHEKPTQPSKGTCHTGYTEKVSIRIQKPILAALKEKAKVSGIGYQTLINQMLIEGLWGKP